MSKCVDCGKVVEPEVVESEKNDPNIVAKYKTEPLFCPECGGQMATVYEDGEYQ